MRNKNATNYGIFLNTMIRVYQLFTDGLYADKGDKGISWITQEWNEISLMGMSIEVPDSDIKILVRLTSTPEWMQVDCGPVSQRVCYTREGAEIIDDAFDCIFNWIQDCFTEPESIDRSLLFQLTPIDGESMLWPVDGFSKPINYDIKKQRSTEFMLNLSESMSIH